MSGLQQTMCGQKHIPFSYAIAFHDPASRSHGETFSARWKMSPVFNKLTLDQTQHLCHQLQSLLRLSNACNYPVCMFK